MKYILLFFLISFSILAQNTDNPTKTSDEIVKGNNGELTQQRTRETRTYEISIEMYGLSQKLPFVRF